MSPYDYLRENHKETMPDWLSKFKEGDKFKFQDFLKSRTVYYPGSGFDGQPVKLFGSTHSAHCFIYVDFLITQDDIEKELSNEKFKFRGYSTKFRICLSENDIAPNGWTQHVTPPQETPRAMINNAAPFGFVDILEREESKEEDHGPFRLAVLFLGADGAAAYDAIFCQNEETKPPFAIVIQDHSYGGNYTSFGENGLLKKLAALCNKMPQFLLVGEGSMPWEKFQIITGLSHDAGGQHRTARYLYTKQ